MLARRTKEAFISYSRTNTDFVIHLQQVLETQGVDTWFDSDDIRQGAQWWKEITNGINHANALIVILSPAYVKSPVCQAEVGYALSRRKRIIPISYLDIDAATLNQLPTEIKSPDDKTTIYPKENWKQLSAINWIFGKDKSNNIDIAHYVQQIKGLNRQASDPDFVNSMTIVATSVKNTLRTNYEYVDQHTRLLERALLWQEKKRQSAYLLKGRELKDAIKWLEQSKNVHDVGLTPEHRDYLTASRKYQATVGRRNFFLLFVVMLMLGGASLFAFLSSRNADTRVSQIQENADRDSAQRGYQASLTFVEQARTALQAGDVQTALNHALAGMTGSAYSAEAEWLVWQTAQAINPRTELLIGDDSYSYTRFSPDLTRILRIDNVYAKETQASILKRVNVSAEPLHTLEKGTWFYGSWMPDGKKVLFAAADRLIEVDADTGKTTLTFNTDANKIYDAQLAPDGSMVVAILDWKRLVAWNAATGQLRWESVIKDSKRILWSPNGGQLLTSDGLNYFQVIDPTTGKVTSTSEKIAIINGQLGWVPDGQKIWIQTQKVDGFTKIVTTIIDARTGKYSAELPYAISYWTNNPDYVVGVENTTSTKQTTGIYDLQGKKVRSLLGTLPRFVQIIDNQLICQQEKEIFVWDVLKVSANKVNLPGAKESSLPKAGLHIYDAAYWKGNLQAIYPDVALKLTPDQRQFYYVDNAQLHIWDFQTEHEVATVPHIVNVASISPDGSKWLLYGQADEISVWSAEQQKILYTVQPRNPALVDATATPSNVLSAPPANYTTDHYEWSWDSKYLVLFHIVSGSVERRAVLNSDTGQPTSDTPILPTDTPYGVFSPDGKLYAVHDSSNAKFAVYETSKGTKLYEWESAYITSTAIWSSDNGYVIAYTIDTGRRAYSAVVYDVTTGKELSRFTLDDPFLSVKFSPKSNILLIGTGKETEGYIYWLRIDRPFARPGKILDVPGQIVKIHWLTDGTNFRVLYWRESHLETLTFPAFMGTTSELVNWATACCSSGTQ